MNIAILGTRGIPNQYGGYEGFAEKLSVMLIEKGHKVAVFNSSLHTYSERTYHGVEIICCYDPEKWVGTAGQFIYDLNCISVCRKRKFDVILQLGYTSSSIWSFLFPQNSTLITNMDGLEWKRNKYSAPVQIFLKYAEKLAVKNSDRLVADNKEIQNYLVAKYDVSPAFIPYGATFISNVNADVLKEFSLLPYTYNILIARMERENNIETVIKGHLLSGTTTRLLIVGETQNKYGRGLKEKYMSALINFLGGVYESEKLSALRWLSNLYFHGHSVGGTNPSLLEAMASSSLICAHNNIFNRSVLGQDAFYFKNENEIVELLNQKPDKQHFNHFINANLEKIIKEYSWGNIVERYERLFIAAR